MNNQRLEHFSIDRMVNKYFLPADQCVERELVDALMSGRGSLSNVLRGRYFKLRTGKANWRTPTYANLPRGLSHYPPYWHVPWKAKERPPMSALRKLERWARFPRQFWEFKRMLRSIITSGYQNQGLPIKGFILVHPQFGEIFQYTDGNRRMGILSYVAARKKDPKYSIPVQVEARIYRDTVHELPDAIDGIRKGYFSKEEILQWFDQPYVALGISQTTHRDDSLQLTTQENEPRYLSPWIKVKRKAVVEFTRQVILRNIQNGRYRQVPVNCPVCEGASRIQLARQDRYGFPSVLWMCQDCGMVYQHPRLDVNSLKDFYKKNYRRLFKGSNTFSEEDVARGLNRGKNIQAFLKEHGFGINKSVLELGCGPGGILKHFFDEGCTVMGAEWDQSCVKMGQTLGIPIVDGGIAEVLATGKQFELIILNHFLEHMENPIDFLARLRPLMGLSSILYIEVPGIRDPERTEPFVSTIQLPHLSYFDSCTLELLLKKAKYDILYVDETCHCVARPTTATTNGKPVDFQAPENAARNADYFKVRLPVHV